MERMKKIAIVIPSCDKYSDLWDILLTQMNLNLGNLEIKKYIICNSTPLNLLKGVEYINVGVDLGWSSNFKIALRQIDEQYIFLWIDDLILTAPVNTKLFENIISSFVNEDGNYLRLSNVPKSNHDYNEFYGLIGSDSLYRTSTVMSIWKKEVLDELLVTGENAWEFEKNGTIRSRKLDKFFVTYKSIFPFSNAVIKGKWNLKVKSKLVNKFGYTIDNNRPNMSIINQISYDIRVVMCNIYYRLFNGKIRLINQLKTTKTVK